MSAAISPNFLAKTKANPYLTDFEYLGYVNKLIGIELIKRSHTLASWIQSVDSAIRINYLIHFLFSKLLLYIMLSQCVSFG